MELKRDRLLQGGRYRIIESIGRGGFGITYLAEQVMAKRKVCIKEFFPKDYYKRDGDTGALTLSSDGFAESMNKFKAKFVKEAQTIATLNHPNIIPIHDIFEENGTAYYVMDYIEGESLSGLVRRDGAMSERDAVAYIKQVASALEHIHEQQIMHLDVKPGNIMVRSKDDHAILIDFGLSKHYDENSGEATSTTPVGVSHGYAPIEQYKQGGVNRFSPETDIYSLGATLYYIATGIVPPHAADMGKDGIGELPSELSSGVCAAIRKSMNYWKEDRPHTIEEFLALLDSKTTTPIVPVVANEKTTLDSDNNIASEQKSTPKSAVQKQEAEQKNPTEQKQTPKATEKKAAPAEKKAAEPKKEWTPKYGVNKPKTSEDEKSKKRKSLWWLWLLILLLIGGVAYLMFMGGDNAAPISNTTNTAKPQLDTFEQIDADSTTLNQLRQDSINMAIRDNAIRDSIASVERERFVRDSTAAAEQEKREEEARIAEKKKREEEAARQAEQQRLAEQKKRDEEAARQAEQQHLAEQKKKEEAARQAEQQRIDNMVAQGLGRDGVYQIGDYYNRNGKEGVVFAVWDSGRHGKIVSLDETRAKWDSRVELKGYIMINGTKTRANSYIDGMANTNKIMDRADSRYFKAIVWCRSKGGNWYLPAINELEAIYNNKSKINSTLAKYGTELHFSDSLDVYYWTSTEYENNPKFCALGVPVPRGYVGNRNKYQLHYVRAVSAF
ncbi:MAG: DUF1566 domain-containing protein [Rikenellaceae bacterium]|nr:DUF1566 domain-containing protein [Rikenellaceae bacterium]